MKLANLRVKTKLMLGFAFLAAIVLLVSGLLGLVAAFSTVGPRVAAIA
jgi:hypothetical protein